MNTLETIEREVLAVLAGLQVDGATALATVRGGSPSADRKRLTASLLRERMAAAYAVVSGREAAERSTGRPGGVEVTVLLADRSERSDAEARLGGAAIRGVFALAGVVAGGLRAAVVAGDRRLMLLSERGLPADEGVALWEQTYAVRRRVAAAPTLDGRVLTGAGSEVVVEVGPLRRAASVFSFPGVDGVTRLDLGSRGREIRWSGELRANSDAELSALEAGLEAEAGSGAERRMGDACGAVYEGCVLQAYERKGPRGCDEVSGEVLQRFEARFEQG